MYDIVVIGGGTGGYAAALYAHNFGLKTALIEKDTVGGTCIVRGCIPAKSWLQAADVFQTVNKSAEFGVVGAEEISFDWPTALERKNKIVNGLVKGLDGLLKAKGVEVLSGFGRIEGPGRVSVEGGDGRQVLETKNIVIATGSVPRVLPGFDIDGGERCQL